MSPQLALPNFLTSARYEELLLAPYAMHSANSRGRKYPEPEHPYRGAFQRDRDHILHCSAFRRLSGKMQVRLVELIPQLVGQFIVGHENEGTPRGDGPATNRGLAHEAERVKDRYSATSHPGARRPPRQRLRPSRQVLIDGDHRGEVAAQTQQAQNGISWHVQAAQPDGDESRGAKFPTVLRNVVSPNFASWNRIAESLRRVEALRDAA